MHNQSLNLNLTNSLKIDLPRKLYRFKTLCPKNLLRVSKRRSKVKKTVKMLARTNLRNKKRASKSKQVHKSSKKRGLPSSLTM